jgi:hypothetical protein
MRVIKTVDKERFDSFVDNIKKKKKMLQWHESLYSNISGKNLKFISLRNPSREVFANKVMQEGVVEPIRYEIFEEVKDKNNQLKIKGLDKNEA